MPRATKQTITTSVNDAVTSFARFSFTFRQLSLKTSEFLKSKDPLGYGVVPDSTLLHLLQDLIIGGKLERVGRGLYRAIKTESTPGLPMAQTDKVPPSPLTTAFEVWMGTMDERTNEILRQISHLNFSLNAIYGAKP